MSSYRTAYKEDGARLHIVAESFWGRDQQPAFFDVKVFNPLAPSYRNTSLSKCYRRNELEKRRAYDERIREVKHGSFSPLVFSTAGGVGATANVVYNRIASLIADKNGKPYSKTINWMRCRLSFSLPRSAIMCIRGARDLPFIVQFALLKERLIQLWRKDEYLHEPENVLQYTTE